MDFKAWLRGWKFPKFSSRSKRTRKHPRDTRKHVPIGPFYSNLLLEELENRVVPASVSWTGNAGTLNWGDADNWSNDAVPTSSDNVSIGLAGVGTINVGPENYSVATLNDTTAALSIASGGTLTISSNATTSTLGQNATVQSGGELAVGAGVTLAIAANTTLTDNGTLSFAGGDIVNLTYAANDTTEIVVASGGSLSALNTTFNNQTPTSNTADLIVDNGGQISAGSCTFNITEVALNNNLGTGNLTGNTFNCPLYLLVTDVPHLSGSGNNNDQFDNIDLEGGTLTSGTISLNIIGSGSTANLLWVLSANLTIDPGATLDIGTGVNLSMDGGTEILDYGSLNYAGSSSSTFAYTFGATTQIVVENGGSLTATNTQYATPDFFNYISEITVDNGGQIQATDCNFTLTSLSLNNNLATGDLNDNAFNCSLYLPVTGLPFLSGGGNNNVQFDDIDILAGTLPSGTLALNPIGTGSNANLNYVFSANFTIDAGATLSIGSGVNASLGGNATLSDFGTITFASNNSLTFLNATFATTELIVESSGSLSAATTLFAATSLSDNTTELVVDNGGQFQASNSTFALTEVALNNNLGGGDLTGNSFNCPLYLPYTDIPYLSGPGNDNFQFSDIDILPATLASGTLALNEIGTGSTVNLLYVFSGTFTIDSGATLSVGTSVNVSMSPSSAIDDAGSLNFAGSDTVTYVSGFGDTTQIVVENGGSLNTNNTQFETPDLFAFTSEITVNLGGQIEANNSTFTLTQLNLNNNLTNGDLTGNSFDCPLYLPDSDIQYLSGSGNYNVQFQDIEIEASTLTGGTLSLNAIGTGSTASLAYVFAGNFTINLGATVAVGPSVNVDIGGGVAVDDFGGFTFGIDDTVTFDSGGTAEIVDENGGSLSAGYVQFNAASTNTTEIVVDSTGQIQANDDTFDLTEVALNNNLGTGSLTSNSFNCPLILPASDIQYLSGSGNNNVQFASIEILAGNFSGATLDLNDIGTGSTANLNYVFIGNFTVESGSTLTVGPDVSVSIQANAALIDDGTVNFNSADTMTLAYVSGDTTQIEVNSGGSLNAVDTVFTNSTPTKNTAQISVSAGGQFTAAYDTFNITVVSLNSGSDDSIQYSSFFSQLAINSGALIAIGQNDFTNIPASPVNDGILASGSSTATINLTNNYWGTTVPSQISAKILDHNVNSALPTVLFSPLLSGRPSVTAASPASTSYATSAQNVVLTAAVTSPSGTINEGTVTFSIFKSSIPVGSAVSGNVINGIASANYTLPASTAIGTYTIQAVYNGTANYNTSSDNSQSLTISSVPTSTSANNATVLYSTIGPVASLSASVTSSAGTVNEGNVTFTILNGSTVMGNPVTVSVSNSSASANYSLPPGTQLGTYTIKAVYNGTSNLTGSSDSGHTLTVVSESTTTTANNVVATYYPAGQNVNLTASVAGATDTVNEGNVTFTILSGSATIGNPITVPVSGGSASASYALPAGTIGGSYTIEAAYLDTSDVFQSSLDTGHTLTIDAAGSSTSAQNASTSYKAAGESVSLTASVTSPVGTVNEGTETFAILNGLAVLGTPVTVNVVNGSVSTNYFVPAGTQTGTYTIQAVYNGTNDFNISTDNSHTLKVLAEATTTAANNASTPFTTSSQSVNLSATIAGSPDTVNVGSETFTILNGSTVIGNPITVGVNNGSASTSYILPASTAGGVYTIEAAYSDAGGNFQSATDTTHTLTIAPSSTSTQGQNVSTTYSATGQTIALTASVTGSFGTINEGTETFTVLSGSTTVGTPVTVDVSNSSASANYSLPAATQTGTYTIQVVYNGTNDYASSTDASRVLTVLVEASSTTSSNASTTYAAASQSVNLSATVSGATDTVNEGSVTFTVMNGGTTVGNPVAAGVSNGGASASYSLPAGTAAGTYTVKAVYNDAAGNFQTSSDASHFLTINQASTATAAQSISTTYSVLAQTVSLTAAVTSPAGTVNAGTETFEILNGSTVIAGPSGVGVNSGTAGTTLTLPAGTTTGTYTIKAVYGGTGNFEGFTDTSHTLTVSPASAATVSVTLDPNSASGAPDHPTYTNKANPTFDVQVNQAGTITVAFNANSSQNQTLSATSAGTYKFTSPPLSNGAEQTTATFNAGLSGTAQSAFSYTIVTAPPLVTSVTPSSTVNTGISQILVTFSEPVDLNSFTPSAITIVGPSGTITVNQPTLVSGSTYSVTFPTQTAQGTYNLTIASSVADYAGNLMSQSYHSTFAIGLPNLAVTSSSSPSTAVEASSITVGWQVANISTTNATGSTWNDTVYLSTKQTLDDTAIPLITVASPSGSLAPGASYSRSETVAIPGGLATGNYYLLFVANANDGQPESDGADDTNDVLADPIALTAPDLQVSNVSGPTSGFTGQVVQVSWMDVNNGTAAATGPWVDNVYTVTDTAGDNPTLLGSFTFNGNLAAGASVQQTEELTLPNSSGTQWFMVTTNATQSVQEGTNFNNDSTVAANSIDIAAASLPDLVVTGITPPANGVFSGTTVPVSFTVANQGQGPTSAPTWQDWVILSQNPNLAATYQGQLNPTGPGGDQILTEQPVIEGFNNPTTLGVGGSYVQTVDVPLPISAQGTCYVYVVPDGTGAHHPFSMPEVSRTDKLAISSAFTVALSPTPALAVSNIQAPAQSFSGQPMNVTWTVTNTGSGSTAATSWTDAVYMSPDKTLDSNATLIGTFAHQGALANGQSYTSNEVVNLPVGVSGKFYFLVQTDLYSQVFQNGNTGNNVASTAAAETVNLSSPPDLAVTSISVPSTAVAGQNFTFSYTVTNSGAGATPNTTWNDGIYLSPTAIYNPNTAISLGQQTHQGSLAAGGSYANSVTMQFPTGLAGAYYLVVDTDSGDVVFEQNKSNNVGVSASAIQASLAPANLVVTSVSAPSAALPGTAILVNWTVTNESANDTGVSSWQDSVYASTGGTLNSNAILLGTFTHNGLVSGNSSYTQSQLVTLPISLLGNYNLFVVADSSNNVYEGGNENNTSSPVPIAIDQQLNGQQGAVSDLQVLSTTSTPVVDGSVTVTWTVKNIGTGTTNANYWLDDVWMSTEPTLNSGGNDVYLGTVQHTNPLAAGSSYAASGTFTVPQSLTSGNYYLIVDVNRTIAPPNDIDGLGVELVYESNFTNNETATSTAISVTPAALPQLIVSAVTAPATATSGEPLAVGWTVTNAGADTGNVPITDSVYLSPDPVLNLATATYLGSVTYTGGLNNGASYTQNQTFTIPAGVAGTYNVFVVTNSNGVVPEVGTAGNIAVAPQPVQIQLAAPADLVAGTVSVPATASSDQDITITYQVKNNGGNAADGSWYDALYLSQTPVWSSDDPFLGTVGQTQDLAPGQSYTGTLTTPLPTIAPGSYYVILRTNILQNIPETNFNNNLSVSAAQVAIDSPALSLDTPTAGTLAQGQSAYYQVIVSAGQTLQFAFTSQDSSADNEVYVSYGTMPTRSQYDFRYSQPFAANQEITVPTTQVGAYYILVYGNVVSGAPENYSLEASIVPFAVQAVSPGQVGSGPATLQISGSQFNSGTTFQLRNAAGTVIDASNVLVKNSTTASATFNFTGQALGSYNVWAIQSDQTTAELPAAVNVEPATENNAVKLNLIVPQEVLVGQPGTITITYDNPGNTDLSAPLILLGGQNVLFQVPGQTGYTNSSLQLFGYNPSGPFGILTPGFQGSITVPFQPAKSGAGLASTFTLDSLQDPTEPFAWSALAANDVPINTSPQEWSTMVSAAESLMGGTWGSVVSFLDNNSVQILEHAANQTSGNAADSLYNFDGLLQYVVGVYGSTNPSSTTPNLPVVASQGEVTLYNGNVNASGNPIPLNSSYPTYILIPGFGGYQNSFDSLAADIVSDASMFPGAHVNVLIANWQGATAGPTIDGATVPWMSALNIDIAGSDLGELLNGLEQGGKIAFNSTTVIGEGSGNDVGDQAAQFVGGLEYAIALNPASAMDGYLPSNLTENYQNSVAYETSSLFGLQQGIAQSNQTLNTGDLNDPILQQSHGAVWLMEEILDGNNSVLNPGSSTGANTIPPSNNPALLPAPEGLLVNTIEVEQIDSQDPDNIIGPIGVGANGMVSPNSLLPYTIDFSNVNPTQAPAQQIVIQQNLDQSSLDLQSFQLTGFGFNGQTYSIPAGSTFYQTTLDFSGYNVDVTASIDESTGVATWTFTTIDPTTGQIPLDTSVGFLPVVPSGNNSGGIGEGFVSYSVVPNSTDQTGAVISVQASVTLNTQPPFETPQITNTVDAGTGLTSSVATLPAMEHSTQFNVSWSGSGSSSGSGVGSYTVYVSDNGAPYTAWLANTTLISAMFDAQDGHAYSFYSVATDNVGNVQPIPASAQASTVVDAAAPTSAVAALPQSSPVNFTVNWQGSHNNGIGIAGYEIFVSVNGGAFAPWIINTTATSATYNGQYGNTYGFYSIATDDLGLVQPTPTSAQATTSVILPGITSMSPSTGPTTGGTTVTIIGTSLADATTVMFGSSKATIVSDTNTQIVVDTPTGAPGIANVTITTPTGTSNATVAGQFTYYLPKADPATSLMLASASSIIAGNAITVTLQAKDASGNNLNYGGSTVVFGLSNNSGANGTFSSVTDNNNGTYTTTFTATTVGSNFITATIDGNAITTTLPAISISPGPVFPANSVVAVLASAIQLGGSTTVTLQARDPEGNNETTGGLKVTFALQNKTGAKGTFSAVKDNHNGTYTAVFTGTLDGGNVITATVNSLTVNSTAAISIEGGTVSLSESTVTTSLSQITAGTPMTVTLQAEYPKFIAEPAGGLTVLFKLGSAAGSQGTFSAVTDHGNGQYTAIFTGTLAGSNTIKAYINGQAVTSASPVVKVVTGPLSLVKTPVTLSAATMKANGTITVTLQPEDAGGNKLTLSPGQTVNFTFQGGPGSISTATLNKNGSYSATFTTTKSGSYAIAATIGGQPVTTTPTLTVTPGPVVVADSVVNVTSGSVQSGSPVTVTLKAVDVFGNPESSGLVVVFKLGSGTGQGMFGQVTYAGNGIYQASFTGTTAGNNTIGATVGGVKVPSDALITVIPGPYSLAKSVATVSPSIIGPGGTTTVTLQTRDAAGNILSTNLLTDGVSITFELGSQTGGQGQFGSVSYLGNGEYSVTFTATSIGSNTILALIGGAKSTSKAPTISVT
jgi:hypothetical protein